MRDLTTDARPISSKTEKLMDLCRRLVFSWVRFQYFRQPRTPSIRYRCAEWGAWCPTVAERRQVNEQSSRDGLWASGRLTGRILLIVSRLRCFVGVPIKGVREIKSSRNSDGEEGNGQSDS